MNTLSRVLASAVTSVGLIAAPLPVRSGALARPDGGERLVGVNFSGAELNGGKAGARPFFDYVYPSGAELGWAAARGMTAIRLPLAWERLQPSLNGPLDAGELARLDAVLEQAGRDRLSVIIDLHNFGAYRGQSVGSPAVPSTALADVWRRIAVHERGRSGLVFGLMNEPHTMPPGQWRVSAEAALRTIRATGADNLVLVSGANWDGAHSWSVGGATSNAAAMAKLSDPSGRIVFEFHQYFDGDGSGTHPDCLSPQAAVAALGPATEWLEQAHRQGMLGEFGVTAAPACLATLDAVLGFLDRHREAWIGWTYWAAGPWWGNYMFSAEPAGGRDKPQAVVLERHLSAGADAATR